MNFHSSTVKLYADYRNYGEDPRTALGAVPRQPGWPDSLCVHCFKGCRGALIQATGYDTEGRPCCPLCASNANRRVS